MIELAQLGKERCILVGITSGGSSRGSTEESLDELALLADTAGAEVFSRMTQDRERYDPSTFIGKGKVEELRLLVTENAIPLVIFDDDLSPAQVRNLERILECKVLDRSGLILDIFAARAKTNEAKTQVELAQLTYLLPRLTRMWTHFSKQFGGVGTKGPGETQIETDRRIIRTRIIHLKEKIERIGQQRVVQRKGRTKHIRAVLVGYTNVGKSTLLNLLSGSDVFVENRLFATLDPTTRLVPLAPNTEILMTDTVGFIRKLPHHLVASFKSTLEEITEADIVLHVSDLSSSTFQDQITVVADTLADLGVGDKPTLMVFNKVDLLTDRSVVAAMSEQFPHSVYISAKRGINILGLKNEVTKLLQEEFVDKTFSISQGDQRLISYLHTVGEVLDKDYSEDVVRLSIRVRKKDLEQLMNVVNKAKGVIAGTK